MRLVDLDSGQVTTPEAKGEQQYRVYVVSRLAMVAKIMQIAFLDG